jgi:malate dehydrogenase (oxaloacetate-decarboxylating)
LAGDVALLERLAQVPVIAHRVTEPNVEDFVTQIGQLPDSVAAVFVTRTDPVRARMVQRRLEQAGGPPVLSDEDTSAIALTAATLAYLNRIGRDPLGARILVADASGMPILTPLLIVTGFPDITMWNSADAPRFPLWRAARDADVVLDPLPCATDAAGLAIDRPEGSVISCSGLDDRFLAAPGLLRALVEHPPGTFDLGVGLYQICASTVAAATPRRYRPTDLLQVGGIADAIAAALYRAAARAETGHGESQRSWRPRRG